MLDASFLNKLKEKYNYDEKIIKALSMIIPSLIEYYGNNYEEIILSAIFNCEIIPCNSHQTISKVLNKRKLTSFVGETIASDIDLRRSESIYVPNVKIIYDENNNTYNIDKVDRIIVTSHTFNYDSLKGLEVLTHALCHLVKSYSNELVIEENVLTIRNGIANEKRKIIYDDNNISLELVSLFGQGLEEGLTLYDVEKIVSLICKDNYRVYDFYSVYTVARVLKDTYKLNSELNDASLLGDFSDFRKKYSDEILDNISNICDDCVAMENEMYLAYSREDKDHLADLINKKMTDELYNYLVSMYKKKQSVDVKM